MFRASISLQLSSPHQSVQHLIRTISSRLHILMKVSLSFLEYKTSDQQTPFIFSPFLNLPFTYFIQLETICHPVVLKSFPVRFVLPFIFHTLQGRRRISCLNHFSLALPNYFSSFVFPCLTFMSSKCSVYCYYCLYHPLMKIIL